MSWKDDVKNHDRRKRAAHVLGSVQGIQVCFVYARKADLAEGSYRDDVTRMYNYVAFRTFKAALWAAVHGLQVDEVHMRFGHVRGHDQRTTDAYMRAKGSQDATIPMQRLASLRWVTATDYAESQAADLYGGFLKAAVWPSGEFDTVEPAYLMAVWHQIRQVAGCAVPLGIFSMPRHDVLTDEPWFPCHGCPKRGDSQSP